MDLVLRKVVVASLIFREVPGQGWSEFLKLRINVEVANGNTRMAHTFLPDALHSLRELSHLEAGSLLFLTCLAVSHI